VSRDGPTARLFAAVDPPRAVCHELSAWVREAAGALRAGAGRDADAAPAKVRVLAPDTLHVTLCFLGGRPVEEIDALAVALDAASHHAAGRLTLGAPLWLPPREPRSLSLEVHEQPGGWLTELQRALGDAFAGAVDWQPERRRFRPHLTVARLGRSGKPSRRARGGGHALPLPPTPQLEFTPAEVVLYRSWLDPQGASYEAIATRTLSAASPSPSSSSGGEEGEEPLAP
jgi:RNA 2',3'-cyclic 3'-phosphodiesterase